MFLLEPANVLLELIIKRIILAVLTERYSNLFLLMKYKIWQDMTWNS